MPNNYENLIIDGNGLAHAAIHVGSPFIVKGEDLGPILRILKSIKSLQQRFQTKKLYFTLDKPLVRNQNFRRELCEYKAHRSDLNHEHVHKTLDHVVEFVKSLGGTVIYPYALEADDVVYYLSKNLNGRNIIVTVDEDLLQLVNENNSVFLNTKKKLVTHENFSANTKVKTVEDFIKFKAVKGDPADNIKGVYMYGSVRAKRAVELWDEWYPNQPQELQDMISTNMDIINLAHVGERFPEEWKNIGEQLEQANAQQFDIRSFKTLCEQSSFSVILNNLPAWKESFDEKGLFGDLNLDFLKS